MKWRFGVVFMCISVLLAGCSGPGHQVTHNGSDHLIQGREPPSQVVLDAPAVLEHDSVLVPSALQAQEPTNQPRSKSALPVVPYSLNPLDLSRPPTTLELMAAGQLGGQLYPTHTIDDPQREAEVNLSFGFAIQKWNRHEYKQAAVLFNEHVQKYPDSPWVAEAKLHLGCDAQYTGRYAEAEALFSSILSSSTVSSSEGMQKMVNKALLRMGVLKAFQNNFSEAEKLFTTLVATSDNWRDRTYASHWLQRLAGYNADKLALLNCGTLALAHLLDKNGEKSQAREISTILPETLSGHSLQDIKDIASSYGYAFDGYRIAPEALSALPLPAIVQIRGQNPGDSGHYWVLEKVHKGQLELYDAQAGRYFSQDIQDFSREWNGNVLVFQNKGTNVALGETLSFSELSDSFGGCCGVPRPPSNLGDPETPKPPKNPCGAPTWSVNPVNMNLYVQDIPLWYSNPIGPWVEVRLSYNAQSSIAYSEPFGNKWQFNYGSYLVVDTGGQVTVFMPDGRHDIYSPDGSGGYLRPSGVFNTLAKLAENHFTLTFADGTAYEYNIPSGTTSLQPFLVKISDANGQSLNFGYANAPVRMTTITDALGRVTTLTYTSGLVTRVTDPFGRFASFAYSGTKLTSITDMGGYVSNLTYDADVYITSIGNSRGTWQFYVEPATSVSNGSNPFPPPGGGMWANYRITITDPAGNSELHMFNGYSNYGWHVSPNYFVPYVDASNNSFVNPEVKKTKYNYTTVNGVGQLASTTFPDGAVERYAYDYATGLRDSITDPHGHTTTTTFNSQGSRLSVTNPRMITTTMTYAANGVDATGVVNALGALSVTYDSHHKITSRTNRLGQTTSYTYNANGQISSITDPLGNVLTYSYYAAGDPLNTRYQLKQVSSGGKILESFTYDTKGRTLTHTDASGLVLTYGYDNLNRITTITWPDSRQESYVYSGCCPRLVDSYTDRAGRVTSYVYDDLQRLIETRNPDGTSIRYGYDRNGNLIKLTDPNGNATLFSYDASDRLIKKTYSDGRTESYTYDGAGLLVERSGGRGIRTAYVFDANHNLTNVTYSDSTPAVSYLYDNADRVVSRTDGAGTFAYTYDAGSHMTSLDGPWATDTISLSYDNLGRRTAMQLQGAEAVSYGYDALSRLTTVAAAIRQFSYTYPATATPFPIRLTRPNGAYSDYTTDSVNRLTSTTTKNNAAVVIASNSFPYTTTDERAVETTNEPSPAALATNLVTFDYNKVNQLTSSTTPTRLYSFDGDGNMTGGYTPAGYPFTAVYDAENRLKSIDYTDTTAHRIDYYYSGDNFLARQVVDGVETRFVRFAGLTIQERNSANAATRSLLWSPGKSGGVAGLLEMGQGGSQYYPFYDGRGNVRGLLDSGQATVASYRYDPFGLLLSKSGTVDQPYSFSTKPYDDKTGLSYFGYRFYSTVLQRWLNRDPIGVRGGLNLYAYVANNPNRFVDPWGLAPGDPFASADEAGRDAITNINDTSIAENKEYGGYVYKNADGTYSYTAPNPGTLDSTQLGPKPDSGTVVGDYHTHGAYDPKYDNENFSPQDKVGYSGDYRYGYLGTPNKTFQRYDSKDGTITPCK